MVKRIGAKPDTDEEPSFTGIYILLSAAPDSQDPDGLMRELEGRAKQNGYGVMKQLLVDSMLGEEGPVVFNPDLPLLSITAPCGCAVHYRSFDEIPEVDVPCPCGNPRHTMIRYEDKSGGGN